GLSVHTARGLREARRVDSRSRAANDRGCRCRPDADGTARRADAPGTSPPAGTDPDTVGGVRASEVCAAAARSGTLVRRDPRSRASIERLIKEAFVAFVNFVPS